MSIHAGLAGILRASNCSDMQWLAATSCNSTRLAACGNSISFLQQPSSTQMRSSLWGADTLTNTHTHSHTHLQEYTSCYTCHTHMQHTLHPSKKSFLPNFVIFLIKTHSAWLSFNTNKTHTVTAAHTPTHTHTHTVITTQLHSLAIWLMHRNAAAALKNTAKNKNGN